MLDVLELLGGITLWKGGVSPVLALMALLALMAQRARVGGLIGVTFCGRVWMHCGRNVAAWGGELVIDEAELE